MNPCVAEAGAPPPDLNQEDPHTIAVMLKQYFRDLPVPLLTLEYGDCFIIAGGELLRDFVGSHVPNLLQVLLMMKQRFVPSKVLLDYFLFEI